MGKIYGFVTYNGWHDSIYRPTFLLVKSDYYSYYHLIHKNRSITVWNVDTIQNDDNAVGSIIFTYKDD